MRFLNPCNDVAFKKIFGSEEHKSVTISFLNSILEYTGDRTIKDIQFLNTEQKRILKDKKDNILDILCTDQAQNKYIVEIQVENVKAFGKRIVFYSAKTYALQLGFAQSYHNLSPVIAISILNFTLFPNKQAHKSIHEILDKKTHEHDLQELSFAFVELPKFTKKEHELVSDEDKWLYFLKHINEQDNVPSVLSNGAFEEACHTAQRMTWSEDELNAYDDAIVKATDIKGSIELAFEKGQANGQAKGGAIGQFKEKLEIAKQLLKVLDINTIAAITGLSIEEIKKLNKNDS